MIYLLNGSRIHPDLPFRVGDTQYPGNWLRSATPEELAAVGITTRNDSAPPNSRWYAAAQRDDGTWNATPRDLTTMRDAMKNTVKAIARDRILQICPEWRQTNIVARGVEVLLGVVQGATLTNAEQVEIQEGLAMWTQIKAIRARSATIEAEIDEIIDSVVLSYEEKIAGLELRTSRDYVGWSS